MSPNTNLNDIDDSEPKHMTQPYEMQLMDSEVDVPFEEDTSSNIHIANKYTTTVYTDEQASDFESRANYADRMDKHVYKKHGLKLMIGCGISYIFLVVFDTIIINAGFQSSSLNNGLVELLKFTISTLIGFVFSEIKKDKS